MAATKAKDLREMSSEELTKRLQDLKSEGVTLRIQQATGQLENTASIRTVRRDVARILTILNQRRSQA
ncbi:50S ribosomal protein L29 [Roseibacillus persicicus]|uniref:Large ribosomal subunit protein uL29 n=1 Tax=Roseibacillus persicicus TaxID=454148 RepID=A0A918TFS9_9BACT|nr:50S ribosomal protein L29 [Roseibacillus persicicus]MDQ8191846.1 50S ribosomal protein L29 [Roseibacillus persicicus]GHC44861.1 50S ribosomal protein L29 [Roseibacillus persicicus]